MTTAPKWDDYLPETLLGTFSLAVGAAYFSLVHPIDSSVIESTTGELVALNETVFRFDPLVQGLECHRHVGRGKQAPRVPEAAPTRPRDG